MFWPLQTLADEDITTTNVGLLLEEDPGLAGKKIH